MDSSLHYEVIIVDSRGVPFVLATPLKYPKVLWEGISKSDAADTLKLLSRGIKRLDFFATAYIEPGTPPDIVANITVTNKFGDKVVKVFNHQVKLVSHKAWYFQFLDHEIRQISGYVDKRIRDKMRVIS